MTKTKKNLRAKFQFRGGTKKERMKKVVKGTIQNGWVRGAQFDSLGNGESRIGEIVDEGLNDLIPRTGIFPSRYAVIVTLTGTATALLIGQFWCFENSIGYVSFPSREDACPTQKQLFRYFIQDIFNISRHSKS